MSMRRAVVVAMAWLALVSCTAAEKPPASTACTGPTPLATVPGVEGPGAKAGPLLLRGFEPGSADATIRGWRPGTFQKVLILRVEPSPDLTIVGRRCSDGHALRFWYGGSGLPVGPNGSAVPTNDFDKLGDDPLRLPAFDGTAYALGVPGYMLFTSDGDWQVLVFDQGRAVGTAVLRVTTAP
jgi:hypothetical protein